MNNVTLLDALDDLVQIAEDQKLKLSNAKHFKKVVTLYNVEHSTEYQKNDLGHFTKPKTYQKNEVSVDPMLAVFQLYYKSSYFDSKIRERPIVLGSLSYFKQAMQNFKDSLPENWNDYDFYIKIHAIDGKDPLNKEQCKFLESCAWDQGSHYELYYWGVDDEN